MVYNIAVVQCTLSLFGGLAIDSMDQVNTRLLGAKDRALLAYLAIERGRCHRREVLAGLLWPDYPDHAARASLRQALHHLRVALGPLSAGLIISATDVAFDLGAGWRLDVAEFDALLAECAAHVHPARAACPQCIVRLQQAAGLYTGDLLAGFSVRDSALFEEWLAPRREHYRREMLAALRDLAEYQERQGALDLAERTARRLLDLDPLDEPAYRQIMRALFVRGQSAAALQQYEALRRSLAQELQIAPDDLTAALAAQIRRPGPATGRSPAIPDAALVRPDGPVFVGRERELARLDQLWRAARTGQGGVVLVSGDAGQGKTLLLGEFARRLQAADGDLIAVGGSCGARFGIGDPYLPFREALGMLCGDLEVRWATGELAPLQLVRLWDILPSSLAALAEAGPDLIGSFIPAPALLRRAIDYLGREQPEPAWLAVIRRRARRPPGSVPAQANLFGQYAVVLKAVARQHPLVLILDDLQWADLGTISLLSYLSRALAGSPILIAGAFRPAELSLCYPTSAAGPPPDGVPSVGRHPLVHAINELKRRWGDIEISLDGIEDPAFVDALIDTEPNRLDDGFRDALFQQTRGHPLFTVELLRGMQERGDLVQDRDGCWILGAALDWETLPARVEAVIAEHIDRLPAELQRLLATACVEGEHFTAEAISRADGVDPELVRGWLSDELEGRRRLVQGEGVRRLSGVRLSRYRFRHALYQRYVYGRLGPVERAWRHEAVATALEDLYRGSEDEIAVQLAHHFREAGIVDKAVHYLAHAGAHAVRLSANHEAIQHYRQALDLLATLPKTSRHAETELQLLVGLTTPLVSEKGYGATEVVKCCARAWELCQQLGEPPQIMPVMWWLATYYAGCAQHETAISVVEELMDVAEESGDPFLVAVVHWARGWHGLFLGHFAVAKDSLEHMVSAYDPAVHGSAAYVYGQDPGIASRAMLGPTLWALGYPDRAQQRIDEALHLAHDMAIPPFQALALTYAAWMCGWRRDFAVQAEIAESCIRVSTEHHLPYWHTIGIHMRGWAQVGSGQYAAGIDALLEAMAGYREIGMITGLSQQYTVLGEAYLNAGQVDQARHTLAEILAQVDANGEHNSTAEIHRLLGEVALAEVRSCDCVERIAQEAAETEAERQFCQAIAIAQAQSARSWELRATMSLARLWRRQGRIGTARAALSEVYGWFTEGHDTRDLQDAAALLDELSGADSTS